MDLEVSYAMTADSRMISMGHIPSTHGWIPGKDSECRFYLDGEITTQPAWVEKYSFIACMAVDIILSAHGGEWQLTVALTAMTVNSWWQKMNISAVWDLIIPPHRFLRVWLRSRSRCWSRSSGTSMHCKCKLYPKCRSDEHWECWIKPFAFDQMP